MPIYLAGGILLTAKGLDAGMSLPPTPGAYMHGQPIDRGMNNVHGVHGAAATSMPSRSQ